MTISEIQNKIERLYFALSWAKTNAKKDAIIEEINRLQAICDAMVEANNYGSDDFYYN